MKCKTPRRLAELGYEITSDGSLGYEIWEGRARVGRVFSRAALETWQPPEPAAYYTDKGITLYHGDCLQVMSELEAQSFAAIITDVPYGTTACAWDSPIPFEPMWACLKRLARPRAAIVLFGSQPFTSALVMLNVAQFKYSWVWEKNRGTGHLNAKREPLQETEDIILFGIDTITYNPQMRSGEPYARSSGARGSDNYGAQIKVLTVNDGDRYPGNVLHYSKVARPIHPTQKPLALMEYLVKTYTSPGDRVLDFTSGSGTTLRACKNLGRQCVGIEQDLGYCEATVNRLAPVFEQALIDNGVAIDDLPMFADLEAV